MKIRIKDDFKDDFVTREAGERLRERILHALAADRKVELDFNGCVIASTSFFDEGIAKLVEEEVPLHRITAGLIVTHIHPRDRELLDALCQRRGFVLEGNSGSAK